MYQSRQIFHPVKSKFPFIKYSRFDDGGFEWGYVVVVFRVKHKPLVQKVLT